ncbi:MAG: winged helix DNA-binding domain-containing protein [Paenibacillus sp.]|nr:winged helix DNA-binding domain-containing protein [Paenibacillus sp.]
MTNQWIANRRLNNQHITGSKLTEPEQVVKLLGAMQAQDYMQVVWAMGLRTQGATLSKIQQAITDRKIILTWTLRGTIHCVPSEDVKWMIQLTASRVLGQAKSRLVQLGLDNETLGRCRRVIYKTLEDQGQVTRSDLLQQLEDAGISTANQRGYHILWNSAFHGLICFGPMAGKEQTFVLLDEWVPHSRELSFEESLAELALRYFISHGPATIQDFAWWSGMKLMDSRRAHDAIKSELQSERLDEVEYWMSKSSTAADESQDSSIYLLPGFDEYILGYKDRSAVLEAEIAPRIVPGNNGVFLPTLVTGGKVIGTWKRNLKLKGIVMTIAPFESLVGREAEVIQAAERYAAFIGLPILKIAYKEE